VDLFIVVVFLAFRNCTIYRKYPIIYLTLLVDVLQYSHYSAELAANVCFSTRIYTMNHRRSGPKTLIAEERRRRIHRLALELGAVKVANLAEELCVGINTIRNDLDCLHREGKLLRVHGGAVVNDTATPRPPYDQTRGQNLEEKAKIAAAALDFLPANGSVFIGDGSTTYQFALRIPQNCALRVVTNSLETACHLAVNTSAMVDFVGGSIRTDSLASDCSLSEEALERLYWDVTFMGAAAIDTKRGITTLDREAARWERKVMEHGGLVVVLCDSSKISRFAYAQVGPLSLIDVLITDAALPQAVAKEITGQGVRVIKAGSEES